MLLVQPFNPYEEEKKKLPFLTRCRMMSRRTRDALLDIRNRMHTARRFAHVKLPTPIMLSPPQPWCCCCCHGMYPPEPFVTSPMGPPPPPPPPPMHYTQVLPYPVCVHLSLTRSMSMPSGQDFDVDSMSFASDSSSTLENEYRYADTIYTQGSQKEQVDSPTFVRKSGSIRSRHSQRRE